jgi:hypothetical protein
MAVFIFAALLQDICKDCYDMMSGIVDLASQRLVS